MNTKQILLSQRIQSKVSMLSVFINDLWKRQNYRTGEQISSDRVDYKGKIQRIFEG